VSTKRAVKSRKCGDRVRKEQLVAKMASRSRFVACALFLAILTQALAKPDKLDEDRDLESQTTESKNIEEQQESGQFFPSPSVSPSNSPNPFCGCEKPATKISGAQTTIPPPGYYSCGYTFLLIDAYCPFTNREVACTCPQGFLFGSKLTDESIVCYSTSFSAYGEGLWLFPCDDDDDDFGFFPSASASFPSIPSFFQEAADSEADIRDLLDQSSDPVEELKTDDLDLDTSGSTKSRDSRVQALTNKRHKSLHKLMDALKD